MVRKICQWARCRSDTRKPETLSGNVIFIPFIKPVQNRERCLRWIKACGRPLEKLNIDGIKHNTYICSKHFPEIVDGKPSPKYPDPTPARSSSQLPKRRRQPKHAQSRKDNFNREQGESEEKEEKVMKLTFDDNGEDIGISEEIHISLTRALRKNETQLCTNARCVNQTNSLIQELQHALWVERRLKERIQYLHRIARINMDLLSVCVDEKKNPVVRVELNKVYTLIQAILEVHSLFDNSSSFDNANSRHDVCDDDERKVQEENELKGGETHPSSLPSLNDVKGEKGNAVCESVEEFKTEKNADDADLRDVNSIMNVVNSCAFKTIEDADTASSSAPSTAKGSDPVHNSGNVIPLLDFKDIPMLNVSNLPRGLSLVNNTPVINLHNENGSGDTASLSSPSGNNPSTVFPSPVNDVNQSSLSTNTNSNSVQKVSSSNIPILNGPLLSFVNKITSPKARARLNSPRKKRKRRIVEKPKDSDDEDYDDEGGGGDEDYVNNDVKDEDHIEPNVTHVSPVEIASPDISQRTTRRMRSLINIPNFKKRRSIQNSDEDQNSTCTSKKFDNSKVISTPKHDINSSYSSVIDPGNSKSSISSSGISKTKSKVRSLTHSTTKIIINKSKQPRPLKKREDPCRGVTASRVMCDVCGKLIACSSTKSWHFLSHMRKFHTGETPERCEVCDKRFHDSAALRSHMQYIHSQGRPHQCAVCGKSFKSRENLRKHGLVHTTEGTVYTCSICSKKFKRSDCLKNHQRIFHKTKTDIEIEPSSSTLTPAVTLTPRVRTKPRTPTLSTSIPSSSSLSLSLSSSSSTSSTCPPPHPPPPEAHAAFPTTPPTSSSSSSSSYLRNNPHGLWDGRAVPIPPVPIYALSGAHSTANMEFPPWHPLK